MTTRRCYGTTFVRTLVDMRIADIAMGQQATVDRKDPLRKKREIRARVTPHAAAPVNVILVRNGDDLQTKAAPPTQPDARIVFEDDEPLERIAIRDAPFHPGPFVVYYLRVEDHRSQTQWSSPIWLDLQT